MTSFDVIVPCYKYGHFLAECVNSVLTQEHVSIRVLIIDDASPDDTPAVARALCQADQRVEYRRHQLNMRHIPTYNEGLEWANADYVVLLSADDYLLPGALARAAGAFIAHPNAIFAFGSCLERQPQGQLRPIAIPAALAHATAPLLLTDSEFRGLSGCNNIVPTPTAIVRAKRQKVVGGYREDLPHTADMEMWLRVSDGHEVIYLPDAQAVYRRHSDNMSSEFNTDFYLGDVRERLKALQVFYHETRRSRDSAYGFALNELADQALRAAIRSFENGRPELSRQFTEFASCINPRWRFTRNGIRLSARLALGARSWSLMRAAFPGGRAKEVMTSVTRH